MDNAQRKRGIAPTGGQENLLACYERVIKEHGLKQLSLDEVFFKDSAKKFIRSRFETEESKKIKACIDIITPFRAIHTVSAFLLGLFIRDELHFDTRSWRRLPKERSPRGSFELFWSWICLFHDVGYYYEQHKEKYAKEKNVGLLVQSLQLKHNLLAVSPNRSLIEKYLRKRLCGSDEVADHGIIGALLLYDALMDLAESSPPYSSIIEYQEFFVKICDTIALHNMWRATSDRVDEYLEFQLYELIPNKQQYHKVFYKDDPILFLLALVDSIDPIKAFCRDKRHRDAISPSDVLQNVFLKAESRTGVKQLYMCYENEAFLRFIKDLKDPEEGMPAWMGIDIACNVTDEGKAVLRLSVDLENTNALQPLSA